MVGGKNKPNETVLYHFLKFSESGDDCSVVAKRLTCKLSQGLNLMILINQSVLWTDQGYSSEILN